MSAPLRSIPLHHGPGMTVCVIAGLLAAAAAVAQGTACARQPCATFDWHALGGGIYAAVRREPAGLLEHSNSLVIVNASDVVVVDAQMTSAATRELIGAIRRVTRNPVRYVINTHWHDDHVFGNAAYTAAFPGVKFVASPETRDDLASIGHDNRVAFVKSLPDELRMLRHHLDTGSALDWRDLSKEGPALDPATREAYLSDIAQAEAYLAGATATPVETASVVVATELTLRSGGREIRIIHLGHAHTRGDVVVWLPRERVLAAGDAVSGIVPMAAATADLAAWRGGLDRLLALNPRLVVPGHGPVQRGGTLIRDTQALIAAIEDRTAAAYRPGATLEEVNRRVELDDLSERWAGDAPPRQLLFHLFFAQPAIAAAYRSLARPQATPPG